MRNAHIAYIAESPKDPRLSGSSYATLDECGAARGDSRDVKGLL
jgi:hypothetical protein